jgi:hypothetical protein
MLVSQFNFGILLGQTVVGCCQDLGHDELIEEGSVCAALTPSEGRKMETKHKTRKGGCCGVLRACTQMARGQIQYAALTSGIVRKKGKPKGGLQMTKI